MEFTAAVKLYENHLILKNRSPETQSGYLKDLRSLHCFLLTEFNGTVFVDEVTYEDLERYHYYLKVERNLVPVSQNRYLGTVRNFFGYLTAWNHIQKNVSSRLINATKEDKERLYLSKEEMLQVFDALEHVHIKHSVITLALTGMRISELSSLTTEKLDFEKKQIQILGKGSKERVIPMSDELYSILIDYDKNFKNKCAPTFFGTKKTGTLSPQYVNLGIRNAIHKIEMKKHVTAHTFRHSFATLLVQNNQNIVDVQKLLGHESIRTTSIYLHSNKERLSNTVNSVKVFE
jgi:site-specific recombinase XerD